MPPTSEMVSVDAPEVRQRDAHVEHLARCAPADVAGAIDFAGAKAVEAQDLLPGGRQSSGENQSIASRISISSASESVRGLPSMLLPRESRTSCGISCRVTPSSVKRRGTPMRSQISSIRSQRVRRPLANRSDHGSGRPTRANSASGRSADLPVDPQGHRQHHRAGQAVRHAAVNAQRGGHAVGHSQTRIGQRHAREQRRVRHRLAGRPRIALFDRFDDRPQRQAQSAARPAPAGSARALREM